MVQSEQDNIFIESSMADLEYGSFTAGPVTVAILPYLTKKPIEIHIIGNCKTLLEKKVGGEVSNDLCKTCRFSALSSLGENCAAEELDYEEDGDV